MTTNTDLISREALLEELELCNKTKSFSHCAIQVLINSAPTIANAQKEQEPVAWFVDCEPYMIELLNWDERNIIITDKNHLSDYIGTDEEPSGYVITPLYTSPPKREWVGLSAGEFISMCKKHDNLIDAANAIDAKLRELNHDTE